MLQNTSLDTVKEPPKNTEVQEDKKVDIQEPKNTDTQEVKNTEVQEVKNTEVQEPQEKDWSKRSYNLKNTTIKKLEELKLFYYPVGTELQNIVEELILKAYDEKKGTQQ